jgi:ATP-dependent helicase YprA (DUF1998 family)
LAQSIQHSIQFLDDLVSKLYQALKIKFKDIYDAFEIVLPDPNTGFNGHKFLPLSPGINYQRIPYSWRDFYTKDTLRLLIQGVNITADVNTVIGQAIHDRLSADVSVEPRPYEHQVKAIALALHSLDHLRRWLHNNTPSGRSINKPFEILALLAPTASGKTEILETIAFQLAIDGKKANFDATKVLMIYPMKEFMKDHIKRFVRDLAYINNIGRKNNQIPVITIGLLNEDTLETNDVSDEEIKNYLQIFFSTDHSGRFRCPLCSAPMKWEKEKDDTNIRVKCENGHDFRFVRFTRKSIRENPPDILLITPDMLNLIMRMEGFDRVFGIQARGFPLTIIMDEPHIYSGILGINTSLIIRDLREMISKIASKNFNVSYTPFILVTSATIPNPNIFLSKLFVVDPSKINIITVSLSGQFQLSSKGLIAVLPRSKAIDKSNNSVSWGIRNAAIEMLSVIAAILPPDKRRIIVFVDSTERAEILAYQIKDYIQRESGFWKEYEVCKNIGSIFDSSVCNEGRPNYQFLKIDTLSAKMQNEVRNKVAEEFRSGKINMLIATSAVEVGIDIGDVYIAVLYGLPPTPINFEQRVGRVGRRGQPSLVIILGNENSGADVYYLSDLGKLIQYVRNVKSYEIPINPANPYAIRAYIGNYITSLVWRIASSSQMGVVQNGINEYIDMVINKPIRVFSQLHMYPQLMSIAQYLTSNSSKLQEQLRSFANAVINTGGGSRILLPKFVNENAWEEISKRWSQILNERYGLSEIKTPLRNIRSLNTEIPLRFNIKDTKVFELDDDIILALLTFSISDLPELDRSYGIFRGELKELKHKSFLRGVITLKSVMLYKQKKGIRIRIPFEVVGGEYHPFIPPIGRQMNVNKLYHLRDYIRTSMETLRNIVEVSEYVKSKSNPWTYKKIVSKIISALDAYLNNVLQNLIDRYNKGLPPEPYELKIVRPKILIFKPIEPLCIIDENNILRCKEIVDKNDIIDAKQHLFYYEVAIGKKPQFVNKLSMKNIKIKNVAVSNIVYDHKDNDLIIYSPSHGVLRYRDLRKENIKVVNHVSTYPIALPILIDEHDSIEHKSRNNIEIELKTIKVLYINIGYTIRTPVSKLYPKFIGKKDKPSIIGEEFETYAVKLSINWSEWFEALKRNNLQLYETLLNEINKDLKIFGISNAPMIKKIFAVTTSHSLSHILLNYHSIYTGGERKDLGELLIVKNNDNNTLRTEVFLFDTVHGGNGVSELLYHHLNDILNDAATVMLQRHIKSKDPIWKFYGEPGDVILGAWPRCIYGNLALSRIWLLRFLAAHNGYDLKAWEDILKNNKLLKIRFP